MGKMERGMASKLCYIVVLAPDFSAISGKFLVEAPLRTGNCSCYLLDSLLMILANQ